MNDSFLSNVLHSQSIKQEFYSLPNVEEVRVYNDRKSESRLFEVSGIIERKYSDRLPLFIGAWPIDSNFWHSALELDVCAVICVDPLADRTNNDLPEAASLSKQLRLLLSDLELVDHRNYQHFGWDRLRITEKEIGLWSYTSWPSVADSEHFVPIVPHPFLDFLHVLIRRNYRSYNENKRPLLIVGRSLDIPALVVVVLLAIHEMSSQDARVDVWQQVSHLREVCCKNVVSRLELYEFIYDCLLQVSCITPTIMYGTSRDFSHIFRRLSSLPFGELFWLKNCCYFDIKSNSKMAPVKLQYALVTKLADFYHKRLFPAAENEQTTSSADTEKYLGKPQHQFAPKLFRNLRYSVMPSFKHHEQFLAVRGPVSINTLLEFMSAMNSRTLLWIADTPRSKDILTSGGNSHLGVKLSKSSKWGTVRAFTMSGPTASGPSSNVTVFHFAGWPISSGIRPSVSNKEFLAVVRGVMQHAVDNTGSHLVTILESTVAPSSSLRKSPRSSYCCLKRPPKLAESRTWRAAMTALIVYLDQCMAEMGEVDVFRIAQFFCLFDDRHKTVVSLPQYIWCFKMVWQSSSLFLQQQIDRFIDDNNHFLSNTKNVYPVLWRS